MTSVHDLDIPLYNTISSTLVYRAFGDARIVETDGDEESDVVMNTFLASCGIACRKILISFMLNATCCKILRVMLQHKSEQTVW